MRILLILLASLTLSLSSDMGIPEMENQLTDGTVKRWVYNRTDATLGGDCTTWTLSFSLSGRRYSAAQCRSRELDKQGAWKMKTNQDGEYVLSLDADEYILDIYYETPDVTPIKVMRLRTVSIDVTTETSDQIYYAE